MPGRREESARRCHTGWSKWKDWGRPRCPIGSADPSRKCLQRGGKSTVNPLKIDRQGQAHPLPAMLFPKHSLPKTATSGQEHPHSSEADNGQRHRSSGPLPRSSQSSLQLGDLKKSKDKTTLITKSSRKRKSVLLGNLSEVKDNTPLIKKSSRKRSCVSSVNSFKECKCYSLSALREPTIEPLDHFEPHSSFGTLSEEIISVSPLRNSQSSSVSNGLFSWTVVDQQQHYYDPRTPPRIRKADLEYQSVRLWASNLQANSCAPESAQDDTLYIGFDGQHDEHDY
ncbi:hypothetical protein AAMO2058_000887800 [Amorphochlora amoebiformis]